MTETTTFALSDTARRRLTAMLHKGVHAARTLNRARILLKLDQGLKPNQVAEEVGVCRATVYNIRNKALQHGWERSLEEGTRTGRPLEITADERARVTALACSTPPEGRARWTLRLLADRAVELSLVEHISYTSVDKILKKTS